jgi:hypothetical protein
MLAGRPHEAAGNGSPRWMAAGPRFTRVHRTRPTGQLARCPGPYLTCGDDELIRGGLELRGHIRRMTGWLPLEG